MREATEKTLLDACAGLIASASDEGCEDTQVVDNAAFERFTSAYDDAKTEGTDSFYTPVQRAWQTLRQVLIDEEVMVDPEAPTAQIMARMRLVIVMGGLPHSEFKELWELAAGMGYTQNMRAREALRAFGEALREVYNFLRMRKDTVPEDKQ